jgi:RNA polymerase sigma-70 factor, ECF subfamily
MSDENDARYQQLLPYYERLVRFIRQLGFPFEDARDLAQDVFLRVYEHVDAYRGEARWSYLQQVARRLAYNDIRDRKAGKRDGIMVPQEELFELPDRTTEQPDAALLRKEIAQRLDAAINLLEESQRICVVMFYIAERSYEQICATLGITLPALKSRLNGARRRLKDLLGEDPQDWREPPEGSREDL